MLLDIMVIFITISPVAIQMKNISRCSFSDGKMRLVSISSYDD